MASIGGGFGGARATPAAGPRALCDFLHPDHWSYSRPDVSFFDEDDEPRSRSPRPRRAAGGDVSADTQTIRMRQAAAAIGLIVILLLLMFVVRSCQSSAKENALKDYNSDVASIVRDSESQVGKPFFDLMRNPSTGDLSTQIAGYKVQAEQQYEQSKKISTPGDMTAAQR